MRRSVSTSGTTQILSKLERVLTYQNGLSFDIRHSPSSRVSVTSTLLLSTRWLFVPLAVVAWLTKTSATTFLSVADTIEEATALAVSFTWFLMVWALSLAIWSAYSRRKLGAITASAAWVSASSLLQSNDSTFWVSCVAACMPASRACTEVIAPFGAFP